MSIKENNHDLTQTIEKFKNHDRGVTNAPTGDEKNVFPKILENEKIQKKEKSKNINFIFSSILLSFGPNWIFKDAYIVSQA